MTFCLLSIETPFFQRDQMKITGVKIQLGKSEGKISVSRFSKKIPTNFREN